MIVGMTIAEFKDRLPNITVKVGKNSYYVGECRGRKNAFCSVTIYPNGVAATFEAAWETVAQAYSENGWVIY